MRCKPGDLAIVTRAKQTQEMLGRVVEIIRPYCPKEIVDGIIYEVSGDEFPGWVITSKYTIPLRKKNGTLIYVNHRVFFDEGLTPISGVPITEEEHDEVTV